MYCVILFLNISRISRFHQQCNGLGGVELCKVNLLGHPEGVGMGRYFSNRQWLQHGGGFVAFTMTS